VHRPHPFQKSCAIDVGVIERSLQIIDDREPFGGDGGSLQRTYKGQLALVALPKIVEVRQSASEGQIVRLLRSRSCVRLRAGPDLLRTGIVGAFTASRRVGTGGVVCRRHLRGESRGLVNGHSAVNSP
jgi:hypothetical protein